MLKKSPENSDGQTDGRTDGHCHSIIRPFFKRAYKNKSLKIWFQMINFVSTSCAFLWNCTGMEANNLDSALVQVMAWWYQAPSHYLRQCCYRSMSPNGVTKPQWLNCSYTGQWSEYPYPELILWTETLAWINDYSHVLLWDVINYQWPELKDCLAKLPMRSGYKRVWYPIVLCRCNYLSAPHHSMQGPVLLTL